MKLRMRLLPTPRRAVKYVFIGCIVLCLFNMMLQKRSLEATLQLEINATGVTSNVLIKLATEIPFANFSFPLDVDIPLIVDKRRRNEHVGVLPIYKFKHSFWTLPSWGKCQDVFLLFLVKSKFDHIQQRNAIRETWGNENYFKHIKIRTVFVLGLDMNDSTSSSLANLWDSEIQAGRENGWPDQDLTDDPSKGRPGHFDTWGESEKYGDILLVDIFDTYFNNTFKTIGGVNWASRACSDAKYVVLMDDDFYVATETLVRMLDTLPHNKTKGLFMGRLFNNGPHRDPKSKWHMTVDEFPFDWYPPFLSAGTVIMSIDFVKDLQVAMEYTKPFRLDDIYLSIVAYRLKVSPQSHMRVYNYKVMPGHKDFHSVISGHGYTPKDIRKCWDKHKHDRDMKLSNVKILH